uniref:TIL domain-containing protein n=1 Tax=Periophthalmus magnuspinnatus TaxID=409849 RepID=A0A3B3ZZU9_9GOBI
CILKTIKILKNCHLNISGSSVPALACPPNSSYSLCVSSCPETCTGVVGPPGCEDVCVEGCECNPGFILSNDQCVALKDCGCVDPSGSYHPVSTVNLRKKMSCQFKGPILCKIDF